MTYEQVIAAINQLKAMTEEASITPTILGNLLTQIVEYYEDNFDVATASYGQIANQALEALNKATTALSNIVTEAGQRAAADTTLQANIDAEASTRAGYDSLLNNGISQEALLRASGDSNLNGKINTEKSDRQTADQALQRNINAEAGDRSDADQQLQEQIDDVASDLSAESTARQNADQQLQEQIDDLVIPTSADEISVDESVIHATDVSSALVELKQDVSDEATARSLADQSLSDLISIESSARTTGDILSQRLASIAALGYDAIEMGATTPLDLDGLAYGADFLNTAAHFFNGTNVEANADLSLVYLPKMDWYHRFVAMSVSSSSNPKNLGYYEEKPFRKNRFYKTEDTSPVSGKTYYKFYFTTASSFPTYNYLFNSCLNLLAIPDNPFAPYVKLGTSAFRRCENLKKVGNINTPLNGPGTFIKCYSLVEIGDLTCPDYHNTNCNSMFYECTSLLRIGKLDFEGVTDMVAAFYRCAQLQELTIIGLGKSSLATYDFTALLSWGSNSAGVATITATFDNAYDRRSAGMSGATIKFHRNIEDRISGSTLHSLTNKGYTIQFT